MSHHSTSSPAWTRLAVLCAALVLCSTAWPATPQEPPEVARAKAAEWQAIGLEGFADSLHHSLLRERADTPGYPRLDPTQIVHIAENLLAWQNADGGWPKNEDWLRVLDEARARRLWADEAARPSTLDNGSTWPQVAYLARVHGQVGLERHADAARRGIEYILREQHQSGGWEGPDSPTITFNDHVMAGVLGLLQEIETDRVLYGFVDDDLLAGVRQSRARGIECVLACQIEVDGRLTAWAQHHDHDTLQPAWGRSYELPAIVSGESVGVVRMLMAIESPTPEVIRAVESAVSWLDETRIEGWRVVDVDIEDQDFSFHRAKTDRRLVEDPAAPSLWARFRDLQTGKPIFCNRSGEIVHSFEEVHLERRTGYAWFTGSPSGLIKRDYPAWRQRVGLEVVPR